MERVQEDITEKGITLNSPYEARNLQVYLSRRVGKGKNDLGRRDRRWRAVEGKGAYWWESEEDSMQPNPTNVKVPRIEGLRERNGAAEIMMGTPKTSTNRDCGIGLVVLGWWCRGGRKQGRWRGPRDSWGWTCRDVLEEALGRTNKKEMKLLRGKGYLKGCFRTERERLRKAGPRLL